MTEDYKKNILNYVTNQINKTEPTNEEIFKEIIETEPWEKDGIILPATAVSIKYTGMIGANELSSDLTILYGGYVPGNALEEARGFITLVDSNFKPIKTFFQYDNGTYLRYIHCMGQTEDGTFYMVDDKYLPTSANANWKTGEKRFVMLNNFAVINPLTNDYSLSLRKSYIFPSAYRNMFCKSIFKNPNSSHYLMVGSAMNSSQQFDITTAIDLVINIGSANEWVIKSTSDNNLYGGSFAIFNDDDQVEWQVLVTNPNSQNNNIYLWKKSYTATNPILSTMTTFNHDALIDSKFHENQCYFVSENSVYFVSNNQRKDRTSTFPRYLGLYNYDLSTNTLTVIHEENIGNLGTITGKAIYISANNSEIYLEYNQNIQDVDGLMKADYYVQRLQNNTWNPILVAEQQNYFPIQRGFYVDNNFNLVKIYLYNNTPSLNWYQAIIKENYNSFNYNGEPYVDYNSTVPQQAEVYSNNVLVFARNLYNFTTNDNQSNATVVIPNSYLNDVDLSSKNLLSETKSEMINDDEVVTKNIYETLYLNFVNTVNVSNEDTGISYPNTAGYINTNISTGTENNYEQTSLSKIRINWANNSEVFPITWETIDGTHKQINFSLYIQNPILSVDLISGDGLTTYMTIDTSSLEIGNTYEINQKLRIE